MQVIIAHAGDKQATFADLLSCLPAEDCRYAGTTNCPAGFQPSLQSWATSAQLNIHPPTSDVSRKSDLGAAAVFDYQFTNSDGFTLNKIIFISWYASLCCKSHSAKPATHAGQICCLFNPT